MSGAADAHGPGRAGFWRSHLLNAGFWRVVWVLLRSAAVRAAGRRRRQRQIFTQRNDGKFDFSVVGLIFTTLFLAMIHALTFHALTSAVGAGEQAAVERHGRIVVDQRFIDIVAAAGRAAGRHDASPGVPPGLGNDISREAARIEAREGGDRAAIEARLRRSISEQGTAAFVSLRRAAPGLRAMLRFGNLPGLLGSVMLLAWFVMMAFQGEGLEMDVQRRRHPMWEFLFSHPVPQGAVFLAEMLAPLAANPIYVTAPIMPGLLFGFVYGAPAGLLAAVVVGIPVTVAAACLGKALEVIVLLRFSARTRGAMIGLMGWAGYATMMALFLLGVTDGKIFLFVARALSPLAALPWPYLSLFLGGLPHGVFSLPLGVAADWLFAAGVIAASVRFCVYGAARGLVADPGGVTAAAARPRAATFSSTNALYRKESLWLLRDRGALVQAFLIPISLAAYQSFNLRNVVAHAGHAWNSLCGVAVVFGTYMLLVLGPKSLASEGAALWISLTWPHGLEQLLLAKARLWTLIASGIVALVLVYAAISFPADAWRIVLLAGAWYLFARSIAARTVTLATVTSESGEIQKVPTGRRMAAQLGIITFAAGIFTRQWNLVVLGVVYSSVMASAMWENFRARLPYLYDPWSEVLPKPPTLMHAMIGIAALVESGAAISVALLLFVPRDSVAIAYAIIYGVCAATVSVSMAMFLNSRGVPLGAIWNWRTEGAPLPWRFAQPGAGRFVGALLAGAAAGVVLGGFGQAYLALVKLFPGVVEQVQQSANAFTTLPYYRESLVVMAVLIAPFAEEFLFRGLLYRALDREWGGWKAVLGSAALFAAYHPTLSWPPVFVLGAFNALLFRTTGRLAPCVATHLIYNTIVLL